VLSGVKQDLLFDFGSMAEGCSGFYGKLRLTSWTSALQVSRFGSVQAAAKNEAPFYFG
jgi:hypothetical protein